MSSARKGGGAKKKSGTTKQATQHSLLESVQTRFSKDVFESASEADPGWKILIVDETAMKVISAAVGMYDIMEKKVTLVEALEKKRAPFSDMGAIYILAPTKESIERLLDDYSSKSKVLYGPNVFVYFLGTIPGAYIAQIKQCKQLIKRLKALSEINVNFLVKEQRAFLLEMHQPFSAYYLRNIGSPLEVTLADKLVTVCATLNEYPYIRYKQTSGICSSVASIFKMKMDEFVGSNPEWWYHGSGKSTTMTERDRSTILLLDRSSDCLTPLMHDFTYQPMVKDLLKMEGDMITTEVDSGDNPGEKENKDVLLNEKDKLWVELRGKHIAEVIDILSARINEVCKSNTNNAFSGQGEKQLSLTQLAAALKELPEYREVMSKLSQHMYIAHECMGSFNRGGLLDLAEIEQILATGQDEDGRSPKLAEVISRAEGSLIRMTEAKDRLRLVLIATISQNGLSSADKDRLIRAAQPSREDQQTLESISKIGIQTLNNSGTSAGKSKGFFGGLTAAMQSTGSAEDESEYASSRYVPSLKTILTDLLANQLSTDDYPSVIPMPPNASSSSTSASSARRRGKGVDSKKKGTDNKWSRTGNNQGKSGSSTHYTGGRNLIFMIGGMAYSEVRICRDVILSLIQI
jgi:syntaxin-binding protein 1